MIHLELCVRPSCTGINKTVRSTRRHCARPWDPVENETNDVSTPEEDRASKSTRPLNPGKCFKEQTRVRRYRVMGNGIILDPMAGDGLKGGGMCKGSALQRAG